MTTNRRDFLAALAGTAALTLAPAPAQAQDWLKKGIDILGGAATSGGGGSLSDVEIGRGLREALRIGTSNVVGFLGTEDGFLLDDVAHIFLPDSLKLAQDALRFAGQAGLLDDLEVQMNRAAEQATPLAEEVFWNAIDTMTINDARGILAGPDDSATRYFQRKMTKPLTRKMSPIVSDKLQDTGAVRTYDEAVGSLAGLPFAPDVTVNLTDYVVGAALDGIFHYVAVEEKKIRTDPAARTTDLLKTVFG